MNDKSLIINWFHLNTLFEFIIHHSSLFTNFKLLK
jgi:hypothetical protein